MADLCRLKGIGPEYAELLEAAGVDAVKELATRKRQNLDAKCSGENDQKRLTRRIPTADVVADCVERAKQLPPMVNH